MKKQQYTYMWVLKRNSSGCYEHLNHVMLKLMDKKNTILNVHSIFFCMFASLYNSKTCVKWLLSKDQKLVFKTNHRLMQVKREHSAIHSTFIKLPFVIKIFLLSVFEWSFYTCFTLLQLHSFFA